MMKYAPLGSQPNTPLPETGFHRQSDNEHPSSDVSSCSSSAWLQYALYGIALHLIIFGAVAFWATTLYRPILFPWQFGIWIRGNAKLTTIACTIIGTLLSALTIYLLNRILILMSKQVVASRGASLSTIDVWNRMFNLDFAVDRRRASSSLLTLVFSFAALYLATAYTTLVTPTAILVTETVNGTEIDFGSDDFWSWYNSKRADGNWNRTVLGCQWYTYSNEKGTTTFPTCPYNNDPINFLSAGIAAAQNKLTRATPAVNYLDKRFEGSTGGALPMGWAGFPTFNDVQFDTWSSATSYPIYNYTLNQQGLTAEVSCQATDDSPITQTYKGRVNNSILGIENGYLNIMNYTWTCPGGTNQTSQIVVPRDSSATLVACELTTAIHEYTVYIGAFGKYSEPAPGSNVATFPNLTCSLKPLLTNAAIKYTSIDGSFRVAQQQVIANSGSRVPNETYQAVDRIFSLATSNSENMVIDSIHGLVSTNSSITIAAGMEQTMRGYVELFGTNLRMYYAANQPAGRRLVTGNFTVWRVGYQGKPIILASLLPPLVVIMALAISYIISGLRTGVSRVPKFDPVDILSLITASAAGGRAGSFLVPGTRTHDSRAKTLRIAVKFDKSNHRLQAVTHGASVDELGLVQFRSNYSMERDSTYFDSDHHHTDTNPYLSPDPSDWAAGRHMPGQTSLLSAQDGLHLG